MDPLVLVVLKVVGGSAGLALFWYILYRGVLDAKKRAGRAGIGGQLMATALTLFSGTALTRRVRSQPSRRTLNATKTGTAIQTRILDGSCSRRAPGSPPLGVS